MKADFLVVTHKDATLANTFLAQLGENRMDAFRYGCRGYLDSEGAFWGRYENGRFISHVPGARAEDGLMLLSAYKAEVSVARLDLQSTLQVTDADWLIGQMRPGKRYKAYIYMPANENTRGSTLYVGAAKSRKRLRVYNKTAQAALDAALGELLRVELQLRDSNADYALAVARRSKEALYAFFREQVVSMALGLDGILPRSNTAHIDVPECQRKADYTYWLEFSVYPGIQRAKAVPGYTQVLLRQIKELLSDVE